MRSDAPYSNKNDKRHAIVSTGGGMLAHLRSSNLSSANRPSCLTGADDDRIGSSRYHHDDDCGGYRDGILYERSRRILSEGPGELRSCGIPTDSADHGTGDPGDTADN
jgi:hypothetical protein